MEALLINGLLAAVILTAAYLRFILARRPDAHMTGRQRTMLNRILLSAAVLLGLQLLPREIWTALDGLAFPGAGRVLRFVLYFADYLLIGYDILRKALSGVRRRQVFDENFLMALATVGAMLLAVYEDGEYLEAIAVMLLYQVGEWFESYAVGRSRRDISALMDIRPDRANLEGPDGSLTEVDPEEIPVGSVIAVRPGEKVPLDGEVLEGRSSLNTSALTGESLPRDVEPGDAVLSGCVNMTGVLRLRTTREFGESTASKILDLVENASLRKARAENFISRFARVYTPAVCYSALALAVLPPLVRLLLLDRPALWGTWLYRALTFLVISCPCALVISIPLSFFAGLGAASRAGVLVKGANFLESLSKTRVVVFDKTGTLTQGVFQVTGVHHSTVERERLLEYAALAESGSSHPISRSLRQAHGRELDLTRVRDIQEHSGRGVTATVDGRRVAAGNRKLMADLGLSCRDCHETGTIIHMALDGAYAGHIVISDAVKPASGEAIAALRRAGVERTVMLTGDAGAVAGQVASELGIDQVCSELLPGDKVEQVEALLTELDGRGKLAFVGDGINDAPVLSRADIGIAMGAMGADAAMEAADVVLMDDDPRKIVTAIRISRKCLRIVTENIVLALGIKAVCLVLGALGYANMYLAIFADVGVMILAVLNALRCLAL